MTELATTTPHHLLALAVEKGADVDRLEKLMDLQERWDANEARKTFFRALSDFQSEIPEIVKTRKGHNSLYADEHDIAAAIRPLERKHGFTHRWEQPPAEGFIQVACIITHESGHSERTAMAGESDNSGGKNDLQARASTVSYLRRYTLTSAYGISIAGEDNDGGKPRVTVEGLLEYNQLVALHFLSIAEVKKRIHTGDWQYAVEAYYEISQADRMALGRARTKGGIWTREDIELLKSDEWKQAKADLKISDDPSALDGAKNSIQVGEIQPPDHYVDGKPC